MSLEICARFRVDRGDFTLAAVEVEQADSLVQVGALKVTTRGASEKRLQDTHVYLHSICALYMPRRSEIC